MATKCEKCGHIQPSVASVTPDPEEANISRSTHDTSSTPYHTTLDHTLHTLTQSVKAAWPGRYEKYSRVVVLMLGWEDADVKKAPRVKEKAEREFKELRNTFKNVYHYEVETLKMASTDPDLALMNKAVQILGGLKGKSNLLIVYYAGHGKQYAAGRVPIWYPNEPPLEGDGTVDTTALHGILNRKQADSPDVLLLYDCCSPMVSLESEERSTNATVEGLFAGGWESQVSTAGPNSFTKALIHELSLASEKGDGIYVSDLHSQLLARLRDSREKVFIDPETDSPRYKDNRLVTTRNDQKTPSHVFLSKNPSPIFLHPMKEGNSTGESSLVPSAEPSEASSWPRVLLAFRLHDENDWLQKLNKWLLNAPKQVHFLDIAPSHSTLLLVAVPVPVWDMIPQNPAISFVAFLTGPSYLNPSSSDATEKVFAEIEALVVATERRLPELLKDWDKIVSAQKHDREHVTVLEVMCQILRENADEYPHLSTQIRLANKAIDSRSTNDEQMQTSFSASYQTLKHIAGKMSQDRACLEDRRIFIRRQWHQAVDTLLSGNESRKRQPSEGPDTERPKSEGQAVVWEDAMERVSAEEMKIQGGRGKRQKLSSSPWRGYASPEP